MKGPFAFLAMETQFRVRFQMNTPDGITSGQKTNYAPFANAISACL
jgi:hypothetical protein